MLVLCWRTYVITLWFCIALLVSRSPLSNMAIVFHDIVFLTSAAIWYCFTMPAIRVGTKIVSKTAKLLLGRRPRPDARSPSPPARRSRVQRTLPWRVAQAPSPMGPGATSVGGLESPVRAKSLSGSGVLDLGGRLRRPPLLPPLLHGRPMGCQGTRPPPCPTLFLRFPAH